MMYPGEIYYRQQEQFAAVARAEQQLRTAFILLLADPSGAVVDEGNEQ